MERPGDGQGTTEAEVGVVVKGRHRFRLDRLLGRGGFGAVWQARCLDAPGPDGDIPVDAAVKVLSADLRDKHRRHTMQRELSSLLAITCDRIPRVYDWNLDPPHSFIAMEYFAHGTLQDLVAKTSTLSDRDALDLLGDLLAALVAAHGRSVVHLDIKPANVLLDGAGGFVLTDFGVSQAPRAGLPMSGLGSAGFQAPEQERRQTDALDMRTDLFGVGATAWSALTGVDLASNQGMLLRRRAQSSPIVLPPISMVRQRSGDEPVAPELEQLVMELLLRDQALRPGDPAAVLSRVRDLVEGRERRAPGLPGVAVEPEELRQVIGEMVDPMVARVFRHDHRGVRRLVEGDVICRQHERTHHAWALLKGLIRVERDGELRAVIDREGDIVGELAALTGEPRNATLIAGATTWIRVLDAAQLEALVTGNPALGVRLIRSMASRFRDLRT